MTPTKASIAHVAHKAIPFTAFQALWIPGTTRLCSLGSNHGGFGVIQIHSLASSRSSKAHSATKLPRLVHHSETEKRVQFKSGTFRCSARSLGHPQLLTGDFEGRISLWDLARTEFPQSSFKAHDDVINCMDGAGPFTGRPEFVTGSRDGTVKLWDMRQNHKDGAAAVPGAKPKPISDMAPTNGDRHDVWCVALGGAGVATSPGADDLMVVAGYDNGDVRALDLRMGKAIFETNVKHGVCAVEFDRRQGHVGSLIATTLEGTLHSFDLVTGELATADGVSEEVINVQSGDDSTLWQARHIPQRPSVFAVTDGGGNIHLYEHGDERTLIKSLGSSRIANQGILSLEFNDDLEGLFVGCDLDNTLRVGMVQL
ncbi:hypothetical protein KVV02_000383 [Mortierella alpina]|uniref:Uncharacterized protein n=1 Tax=Mortierella alpina TaxID=64518 RepID=A0A9P8CUS2_MORAP|nr:hypothetical protein KVV02_000383 [Mortierella alpina]